MPYVVYETGALILCKLGKNFNRRHYKIFFFFLFL